MQISAFLCLMEEFFKDLKVVELASVLAGPAVGMFFAELGAEVIKIESPLGGGDVTRSWKLKSEDPDARVSAYFSAVNFKKSYRTIDLRAGDGLNEVYRLVKEADIVLSNYKWSSLGKIGLDYGRLKTINPQLIYCHLEGFAHDRNRPAYDVVVQAETGFMHMNGQADGPPTKMPVALMDILAAEQMKNAILLALLKREKTGRGSHIECSLEAAGLASLANQASNYLMTGNIPQRIGSQHPNIAPYGDTFSCKDGKFLVLAVGSDKHFERLCKVLEKPKLATSALFASNLLRVQNRAALVTALQEGFSANDRGVWLEELETANVPAGAIRDMAEVFETTAAKEMIREEEIEGVATRRISGIGFRFLENF